MIPLVIELDGNWKKINTEIETVFPSGDKLKLINEPAKSRAFEFYIDPTNENPPINAEIGLRLDININNADINYNSSKSYYARAFDFQAKAKMKVKYSAFSDNGDSTQSSKITDRLGNEVQVGAFGAMAVSNRQSEIALTFEYPLNPKTSKVNTAGLGTVVSQYNGNLLKVQSNGVGTANFRTNQVVEYEAGSTIGCNYTVSFNGNINGTDKALAVFGDDEDGIIFGYDGSGDFVCGYRNENFASTTVSSDNFNGDFDIATYLSTNKSKMHRVRKTFGYLGVGDIAIEIKPDIQNREWQTVHVFKTDGALNERTHIGTAILPVSFEVESDSNDIYMLSGSMNGQSWGDGKGTQHRTEFDTFQGIVDASPNEQFIIAYRSKATLGGKTNKIRTELIDFRASTDSEGLYEICFYNIPRDGITGANWGTVLIDSDPLDLSALEKSTTSTYDFSSDTPIYRIPITVQEAQGSTSGSGDTIQVLKDLGLIAYAENGEFLITKRLTGTTAGSDNTNQTNLYITYKDRF